MRTHFPENAPASPADVTDTHNAETIYWPHQYSVMHAARQQAELLRTSLKHFPPFPFLIHPHTTSMCVCESMHTLHKMPPLSRSEKIFAHAVSRLATTLHRG